MQLNIAVVTRPMTCRRLRSIALLFVLFLSLLPLQVAVADPGNLDDTFLDPNPTEARPTESGFSIGSFVQQSDGKIVVGGHFYTMNGETRDRLARLNSDGSLDKNFARFFSMSYSLYTLAPLDDGDIVAAGSFTRIGSTPVARIVRLNGDDATVDTSFTSPFNENTSSSVAVVVPLPDGDLLVAGDFTQVAGVPRGNIARLNADGTLDTSFMNNMAGANSGIRTVVVQPNGKILIGGFFTEVNGVPRGRIARLEADGSLDMSFLYGAVGVNDIVSGMVLQPDGKVVIGGYFTNFHDQPHPYLIRVTTDGVLDPDFMTGHSGPNDVVRSITRLSDGRLIVTGYFTSVDGVPRGRIARLDANGILDTTFMDGLVGADDIVLNVKVQSDGKIIIGGGFEHINGASRNLIARLNSTGALDHEFMMAGANNEVTAVEVQPTDGKILVGGTFSVMSGHKSTGLSRLNPDGSPDLVFLFNMPGVSGNNGRVDSIAVQPDGKIYIGGSFTKAGYEDSLVTSNNIARLNTNGTLDWNFDASGSLGTDGPVYAIAVQPDGKVLLGGDFQNAGGGTRTNIARLNPDGTLDTEFIEVDLDNIVYSIALQQDGKVIIVGEFTTVNGQPRSRVARLNADGTLDTTYQNGAAGANSLVRWVDLDPQDNAVIGGWFTQVNNGVDMNRVARLSALDGSPDPNFQQGLGELQNGVRTLEVLKDGSILIGGEFLQVYGENCQHIARLTPRGALDRSFACGELTRVASTVVWVNDIAVQPDGNLIIGGNFTHASGAERGRIARLDGRYRTSLLMLMK